MTYWLIWSLANGELPIIERIWELTKSLNVNPLIQEQKQVPEEIKLLTLNAALYKKDPSVVTWLRKKCKAENIDIMPKSQVKMDELLARVKDNESMQTVLTRSLEGPEDNLSPAPHSLRNPS